MSLWTWLVLVQLAGTEKWLLTDELAPTAWPKTAFSTVQGLWQFKVMPFALCNAPATLKRLMEKVLNRILPQHSLVYLDDLLVHSLTFEEALHSLCKVMPWLEMAGLKFHPVKCCFMQREVSFLEHRVGGEGRHTEPWKISTIQNYPSRSPASAGEPGHFCDLQRTVHSHHGGVEAAERTGS
ncbi:UNVERIFIED_CONTAM: hypothetical protein FKN15_076888 [Acipenser sinensis]